MLSFLFFMSCGLVRGFQFEKAVSRCMRVDRPISVSAVPFGPGSDIRRSCKLLGALLLALCAFRLVALGRFIPCGIGADNCRLRHIGWEKSFHGLTSRPRETSNICFLNEVLFLCGYPPGSGLAFPTWSLPAPGGVALPVGLDHGGMLVRSDPSSPVRGRIGNRSGGFWFWEKEIST